MRPRDTRWAVAKEWAWFWLAIATAAAAGELLARLVWALRITL